VTPRADYLVILNPKSGDWRPHEVRRAIQAGAKRANLRVDIWPWERPEQMPDLVKRAQDMGYPTLVAAGGDGTVHHVAQHLVGTSTHLAVLPTGSGNAIGHHLGIKASIGRVIEQLPRMNVQAVDTATVNELPFVGFCSLGLAAKVIQRFANGSPRGLARYAYYTFKDYFHYSPIRVDVQYDTGRVEACRPYVLAVMNTAQFGNGINIAPGAQMQDGRLNVVQLRDPGVWRGVEVAYRLFTGDLQDAPYFSQRTAAHLHIKRAAAGPVPTFVR